MTYTVTYEVYLYGDHLYGDVRMHTVHRFATHEDLDTFEADLLNGHAPWSMKEIFAVVSTQSVKRGIIRSEGTTRQCLCRIAGRPPSWLN